MRRAALLLTVVASSCVLPQFEIVPSPDDAAGGSASGANGSSAAAGASAARAGSGGAVALQGDGGDDAGQAATTGSMGTAGDGKAGSSAGPCTSPMQSCTAGVRCCSQRRDRQRLSREILARLPSLANLASRLLGQQLR